MKRNTSFWLILPAAVGLLAFALRPGLAQQSTPAAPGTPCTIHGQVTNPTGAPQQGGEVALSTDGGKTLKYTFPVNDEGSYSGKAAPGTYSVLYREKDTPAGKAVDFVNGVTLPAGGDVTTNFDMSRASFIAKLPEAQQKELAELKKHNESAMSANKLIAHLNADLRTVTKCFEEAASARTTAIKELGSSATPTAVDTKADQIKTAQYTQAETLMKTDTGLKPEEPLLWAQLGQAQIGLKKYPEAIATYQKAVTLEEAAKSKNPAILGSAYYGLGEAYARTGKVTEANQNFDAAVKADPTRAAFYLSNASIIYFEMHNSAAQVAAAEHALQSAPNMPDPTKALMYYIKGQGLVQNATMNPKTQQIVLPPACASAYQNYLKLAPNGEFASEVKGILQQAGIKP